MKPANWEELSYDERQAFARELYQSARGQFLESVSKPFENHK